MTVYEEIGLPRVVNASGRVTVLGVSTISDKVAKAAVAGGQSYVVVEDLMDKAGGIISQLPHRMRVRGHCPFCSRNDFQGKEDNHGSSAGFHRTGQ